MSLSTQGYLLSILVLIETVFALMAGHVLPGVLSLLMAVAIGVGSRGVGSSAGWGWWLALFADLLLVGYHANAFTLHGDLWPHGVLSAVGVWFLGALLVDWMKEPQTATH